MNGKAEQAKGVALVTGASSGMGYEYALQLAQRGYDVVLVSNEEEKLVSIAADLADRFGVRTRAHYMDLARVEAAQELYDLCEKEKIVVDVLVNNAGFFFFSEVAEADLEKAKKKMILHMVTPSLLCQLFGKDMKARRFGYILNMSSISAWMPYPGLAHYAGTKRYLKNFSRSLRSEMLDHNVGVTCVCPGAVATNLFDKNKVDYKKAMRYGIMMTADKVVRIGLRALFRKRSLVIPGWLNKLSVFFVCLVPAGVIVFIKRNTKIFPSSAH
jgi:short-subunit dehydrogenase